MNWVQETPIDTDSDKPEIAPSWSLFQAAKTILIWERNIVHKLKDAGLCEPLGKAVMYLEISHLYLKEVV